jgi:hypothetical protein
VARTEKRIDRANWVSLKPFGIGEQKPNNLNTMPALDPAELAGIPDYNAVVTVERLGAGQLAVA